MKSSKGVSKSACIKNTPLALPNIGVFFEGVKFSFLALVVKKPIKSATCERKCCGNAVNLEYIITSFVVEFLTNLLQKIKFAKFSGLQPACFYFFTKTISPEYKNLICSRNKVLLLHIGINHAKFVALIKLMNSHYPNYGYRLTMLSKERIFKWTLGLLFAALLWFDVFHRDNFKNIVAAFMTTWHNSETFWLILAVVLMPLNWFCEIFKWRILMNPFKSLFFSEALRAIAAGVTFSLFFPNRVGEFGGRVLFLSPELRIKGTLTTFVGSWAQQFILVTFGAFGLTLYVAYSGIIQSPEKEWMIAAVALGGVALLGCFLKISVLVNVFKHIKFLRRFPKLIQNVVVIRSYSAQTLLHVLVWSFVRYSIYTLQYYCIIRFFGLKVVFLKAIASIATIYLLQTGIPFPPLVGLMARGEIAIQIWGEAAQSQLIILAATFTLWIINLIIPALLGMFFLLNLRFTKKNVLHEFEYQKIENGSVFTNIDVHSSSISTLSTEVSAR